MMPDVNHLEVQFSELFSLDLVKTEPAYYAPMLHRRYKYNERSQLRSTGSICVGCMDKNVTPTLIDNLTTHFFEAFKSLRLPS
jgi:hypothetical protein